MKATSHSRNSGRRSTRRHLAHLLKTLFSNVTSLKERTARLHSQVSRAASFSSLRVCIEALLHELHTAARGLAARASAMGRQLHSPRPHPPRPQRARKAPATRIATVLIGDCLACGRRLCAIMQAARLANDAASAGVAYSLMRTLEKQLWLLRPHAPDSNSFPPFRLA